jgi:hypothetical protein
MLMGDCVQTRDVSSMQCALDTMQAASEDAAQLFVNALNVLLSRCLLSTVYMLTSVKSNAECQRCRCQRIHSAAEHALP